MGSSRYPFGAEVSLDNSYVATTAFVNNAANVAYYDADAAKVAYANYDNHNPADGAFDNDDVTDDDNAVS
jgi:hypothetical protein